MTSRFLESQLGGRLGCLHSWEWCGRNRLGERQEVPLHGWLTCTVLYAGHCAGGGALQKQMQRTLLLPSRALPQRDTSNGCRNRVVSNVHSCAVMAPLVITAKGSVHLGVLNKCLLCDNVPEQVRENKHPTNLYSAHYYVFKPHLRVRWRQQKGKDQPFLSQRAHRG